MRRNYIASLAGSLLLTSALSGCGAVSTAQSGQVNQLPTAPPAPTPAPAAQSAIAVAPALPQLSGLGDELLRDEFDSDLKAWTARDIVSIPGGEPAHWTSQDGRLDQLTGPDGLVSMDPVSLLIGNEQLADYTVQAMGQSRGNEAMGLVGRASAQGFYYLVVRNSQSAGTKIYLAKYDAPTDRFTTLAEVADGGWNLNQWTALGLKLEGTSLVGYVNGKPVVAASDASFSAGQAGLYGYGLGDLSFDHFVVNAAK